VCFDFGDCDVIAEFLEQLFDRCDQTVVFTGVRGTVQKTNADGAVRVDIEVFAVGVVSKV
jgi:hypothetical protein